MAPGPLFIRRIGAARLAQVTTPPETVELLREIEEVFTKTATHLIYHHKVCRAGSVQWV